MTALLVGVGAILLAAVIEPKVSRILESLVALVIAVPILIGLGFWDLTHGRRPF